MICRDEVEAEAEIMMDCQAKCVPHERTCQDRERADRGKIRMDCFSLLHTVLFFFAVIFLCPEQAGGEETKAKVDCYMQHTVSCLVQ